MRNTDKPVIVEQIFNTKITDVWDAITKIDQMKQWYFENIKSIIPEADFETQFMVLVGERKYPCNAISLPISNIN